MGAKSYYFEDNQIKSFEDSTGELEPKKPVYNPYSKVLKGYNILVIDDNPINLIVAEKTLNRFGATTFRALSGDLGIACYNSEQIHLILMDIQMPVLDGFASCKKLKKTKKYATDKVPVIAYTTFAFEEIKEQIEEAEMDGYIGKPFTQAQVISSLISIVTGQDGEALTS